MILKPDDTTRLQVRIPAPLEDEKSTALQIKMVFGMVMLVIVIWVGVLIVLGRELMQRVFS